MDSEEGEATSIENELSAAATNVDTEASLAMVIDAEEPPLTVMVGASAIITAFFFSPVRPQQTQRHLRSQQRLP